MNHYSIYIELDIPSPNPETITELHGWLVDRGFQNAAVGTSPAGRLDVLVTALGDGLSMAQATTLAIVQQLAGAAAVYTENMTEEEFNARQGFTPIPDLVSVSEAADRLGISRQRVLQMVETGAFRSARKVGNTLVIAATEVERKRSVRLPANIDVTDSLTIDGSESRPITVLPGATLTVRGQTSGPIRVMNHGEVRVFGQMAGTLAVELGARVLVHGMLLSHIIINEGVINVAAGAGVDGRVMTEHGELVPPVNGSYTVQPEVTFRIVGIDDDVRPE